MTRLATAFAIAGFLAAGTAAHAAMPGAESAGTATQAAEAYRPVALSQGWTKKVQLVSVTHPQWLRELAAFRGKIVVVDNWATWCAPCVERFPRMLAIARKWSRSDIVFVSLSLDDRDDAATAPKVRAFLEKNDARIPNYLMNEITPDAFEKLGLLGIPAVHIFDRSGKLALKLTGDNPNSQFTEADVEAALRSMTKK